MRESDERREPTWSGTSRSGAPRGGAGADELPFGPMGRASSDAPRPERAADRKPEPSSPFTERLTERLRPRDDTPDLAPQLRHAADDPTRRLAIGAAALAGLLVVLVGGWSILGHRHHGIPVISAPSGPIRVKPLNPGGMQITALPALNADSDGKPTLAPAPEQPRPQILQKQVDDARRDSDAPSAASPPAPAVAAEAPPAPAARPAPEQDATATAPASVAPPVAAPVPPVATRTGGQQVQLGALASEVSAKAEWKRLAARAPALMDGRSPVIEHVTKGAQSFWRLRTGGFDSIAQATEFCVKVRAAGGACALASF